jgi:hypothetical protein
MKKKNVALLVNIPTHLNVVRGVSSLLHTSTEFTPVIVFCSVAALHQCRDNLPGLPYPCFVWTGEVVAPVDTFIGQGFPMASLEQVETVNDVARLLPGLGIYRRFLKICPLLPSQAQLNAWIRKRAVQVVHFTRIASSILQMARLIGHVRLNESPTRFAAASGKQPFITRLLLAHFGNKWRDAAAETYQGQRVIKSPLNLIIWEGILRGVIDQHKYAAGMEAFFTQEQIELVLMPEVNLFYDGHNVVRVAQLLSIPVAVVPYTIVNTLEWAEAFVEEDYFNAENFPNRVFARAFPHWVLRHRNRELILPPTYILACEYFNITPGNPWLINSGNVDVIAAESRFMCSYYERSGIAPEKISFTGALSDDQLFAVLAKREYYRHELQKSSGVILKNKIVLIGLPPDQFDAGKRTGCEFTSHQELINYMVDTVIATIGPDTSVLINLHPRIRLHDATRLEISGARIIHEAIEDLVPLADLYISVVSATIRLGISCGIPVVNYDAYQYDYDDYKGLAGVCEVKTKHDYESVVGALIHDQLFYSKIHAAQKTTANNLCIVDGKAGERLLNLFDRLTSSGDVTGREC